MRMFLELLTETSKLWFRQYLVYVIVQPFIVIVLPDTALWCQINYIAQYVLNKRLKQ